MLSLAAGSVIHSESDVDVVCISPIDVTQHRDTAHERVRYRTLTQKREERVQSSVNVDSETGRAGESPLFPFNAPGPKADAACRMRANEQGGP